MPSSNGNGKAKVALTEIGSSGLRFDRQSGQVTEEFHPDLQGKEALRVYRSMSDNDPVVRAVLFAIDMLCRQVTWVAEIDEEGKDEDRQFLEECMDDMSHSWSDFVSEIMSMVTFGFSFFEIVYKQRTQEKNKPSASKFTDGRIGWRKFAIRAQESLSKWEFDDDGGIKAFVQRSAPDYNEKTIPMEKGLLFRTSTLKNNPEGHSALRAAYRPWYMKKRVEELEGVGIERDLAGMPMAEVDPAILSPNATVEEKAMLFSIQQLLKNIRRDKQEGIIWPLAYNEAGQKMFEFKLLTSGGARTFDTNGIIDRWDKRITMTVLADFIMLGHSNVGSFALSSDKTDLFAVALGSWLKAIEDVLNRFAVPRLFEINGMSSENLPRIVHGDIEKPNMVEMATLLATLSGIGMPLFPDEELEKHIREIAGLPEPGEEAKAMAEAKQESEKQMLAQQAALPGDGSEMPPDGTDPNAEGDGGEQDLASLMAQFGVTPG